MKFKLSKNGLYLILLLSHSILFSQQDFSFLQPVENNKYKRVLKQAKKDNKSVLFIAYSAQSKTNALLDIEPTPQLRELSEQFITTIADWNIHTRNQLFNRVDIPTNPFDIFMHPDDVVLHTASALRTYEDLVSFIGQGLNKRKKYDNLIEMSKKGDSRAQKELSLMLIDNKELVKAAEVLDNWLQENLPLKEDDDYKFLAAAQQKCLCSPRIDMAMQNYEHKMVELIGKTTYLDIRQSYILYNLKEVGLLEPFYVWESYDASLGVHADSLYRLFAVEYFRSVLPDKQVMLDEIYNYLYYYPNTPWPEQQRLFDLALKNTEHKDDWSLLLDLIEYQILSEETYTKKDYKSFILYNLGNVTRAMELMAEVEGEAILEDPDFQPLLYRTLNQN